MKQVGVGLVGCGVVGGGVVRRLERNRELLARRCGVDLSIRAVAVRDRSRHRGVEPAILTDDWRQVVTHPEIAVVVELMGGVGIAGDVALAALRAKKPLVTANKALLAERGAELFAASEQAGASIYFEASVAGGIPIVKALREGLRANRIEGIYGIINGTCNYILSRMTGEGLDFESVLAEAKALGYAEADESLDVDGIDAAHKAAILASLAYGFWVPMRSVCLEGIRGVSKLDVQFAAKLGYAIKLLAVIKPTPENRIEVRVHPTLIPSSHVLASVSGVFNAVAVEGDVVGPTLFYGRGAGPDATASAVLSDIAEAAMDHVRGAGFHRFAAHDLYGGTVPVSEIQTRYYMRLTVVNQPGVLAQIAGVLGRSEIGISSVFQPEDHVDETVPLVLLLDRTTEAAFKRAFDQIRQLPVVREPCRYIRVEELKR